MNQLLKSLTKVENSLMRLHRFQRDADVLKMLTAELLLSRHRTAYDEFIKNIHAAEFRVYSQWGDDGIIQFLINYLEIQNKTFIEFGTEDYTESNTRFLLQHDNWTGLIFDGSKRNIRRVQADNIYWRHNLTAVAAWLTPENVDQMIVDNGFKGEIGLLHIDVDGPDYHYWKAVHAVDPTIVIVEYDHLLGAEKKMVPNISKKYTEGSSLAALCDLAEEKGYAFIGCESHGVNAYFVRKDKLKELKALTSAEGYIRANVNHRK